MQFLIHAWDGNDELALERRLNTRPDHLVGAKKLKENGNFIIGGAMLDENGNMKGSTMIVEFDSETDLQKWLDEEPYILNGVWKKIEVFPFRIANV
ncbi:MAG: YciI family protein [Chitinophagaceae bacterium]|nr:YciI family protein [Chitinophagaceae bacterium]